jgi:sterol 3beta-glucosyltransferase
MIYYLSYWEMQQVKFPVITEQLGLTCTPNQWSSFRAMALDHVQPVVPACFGCSPLIAPSRADWSPEAKRSGLCGYWVIDSDEQLSLSRTGDSMLWGDSDVLRDFIDADGARPPAYMGWGSMVAVSPDHMTQLAVKSLMQAGLRGIICAGKAELSLSMLAEHEDLRAYAQRNIVFVDAAPHEWLFPQCSVIVHHGGASTTAAGFRSGKPTIVTPCLFDQFESARLVNRTKAGIGLAQMSEVSAESLATAMTQCVAPNSSFGEVARELGGKLQREHGVAAGVEHVRRFLAEDVASGSWLAAHEKRKAAKARLHKQDPDGCFFWFWKGFCGSLNALEPTEETGARRWGFAKAA